MNWQREPYRLFFPIGFAYGLWGVAIWLFFAFGWLGEYPARLHSQIMTGGFLGAFAFGFLMTAIPRMTRTHFARPIEVASVAIPLLVLPVFSGARAASFTVPLFLFASFLGLMTFAFLRFRTLTASPPQPFVFIGIGLLSGGLGLFLQLISHFFPLNGAVETLGRILFFKAFMLALVLGVGSRLIPALIGWGPLPNGIPLGDQKVLSFRNPFVGLGALFVTSYIMEALGFIATANIARAGIGTWIAFRFWKLHRWPAHKTALATGVWMSGWMTLVGLVGLTLAPGLSIVMLHLMFIGGFGLMTLMVASRVVLAHGGYNLVFENRKLPYFGIGALLVLASSARFLSIYSFQFVSIAAWLWILALSTWALTHGWRIFKPMSHSTAC